MRYEILIVMLLGAFLLSGCGRKKEQPVEKGNPLANALTAKMIEHAIEKDGGDATVKFDGNRMEIQTAEGKTQIATGSDGSLPNDFPKEVPVYTGAGVVQVVTTPQGSYAMLRTTDAQAQVLQFYKDRLTSEGWKTESSASAAGSDMLSFAKESRKLGVVLSRSDTETLISLTLSQP